MKKIYVLLCLVVFWFLSSCSNLSVDDESALKAGLPSDFDWKVYKEINNDVAMSQIVMDIRKAGRGPDSTQNCVSVLSDEDFAREVYLDYLQCPEQGWDKDDKCGGIYANNSKYSIPKTQYNTTTEKLDTISWQCVIGTCWNGGWNAESFLQDSLPKYSETSKGVIKAMCQFVPDVSTSAEAKNYLENFNFDSTLIEQHYSYLGRYDGRPYKYCEGQHSEERTLALADKRGAYYDYGRYTFCLEKSDQKIYVAK